MDCSKKRKSTDDEGDVLPPELKKMKPVSAYALFFRDTQAAIKGQNPNASFGEVSKIVASMWDALDSEHKNVYKKKTEAAKKEYLKALAAYRASLVSKGAGEGEGMYGGYGGYGGGAGGGGAGGGGGGPPQQYGGYQPQGAIPSPPMSSAGNTASSQQQQQQQQQQQSMGNKKGMMGGPMQGGQPPSHQAMMQSPMGPVPAHMGMQHMPPQQQQHGGYMQQVPSQQHMPVSPQQHVPVSPHMQQHVSPPPMVSSSPPVSSAPPSVQTSVSQQNGAQGQMKPPNSCIRHGCLNPAITNPEWEDEYCSNECVVSHCRDVFTNWVAGNKNQSQNFSTVK